MRLVLSGLLIGVALTLGGCFEGPKGDKGDRGEQGAAGASGPAGPAGAIGPAGPAGPAGVAGAAGPAGKDGAPGKDGTPGRDGAPGKDGAAGKDGATIRMVRHSCAQGQCIHACDKSELVVSAICVGGTAPALFKSEGGAVTAACGAGEGVSMQLYCMKP